MVTDPAQAFDHDGHGSHTTGIAASTNPDIGVAYASKFIDVRVFADANEAQLSGDPLATRVGLGLIMRSSTTSKW